MTVREWSCGLRRAPAFRRQIAVEPAGDRRQRGMGELRLELAPDPRHMDEIAGLAVALQQPGEIAEDAGIALGPRQRIGGIEAGAVELGKARRDSARSGAPPSSRETSRRASSISETRSKQQGPRTASWKSSRPTAAMPLRPGQHDQIVDMVVVMDEAQRAPCPRAAGPCARRRRNPRPHRRAPRRLGPPASTSRGSGRRPPSSGPRRRPAARPAAPSGRRRRSSIRRSTASS